MAYIVEGDPHMILTEYRFIGAQVQDTRKFKGNAHVQIGFKGTNSACTGLMASDENRK